MSGGGGGGGGGQLLNMYFLNECKCAGGNEAEGLWCGVNI